MNITQMLQLQRALFFSCLHAKKKSCPSHVDLNGQRGGVPGANTKGFAVKANRGVDTSRIDVTLLILRARAKKKIIFLRVAMREFKLLYWYLSYKRTAKENLQVSHLHCSTVGGKSDRTIPFLCCSEHKLETRVVPLSCLKFILRKNKGAFK